LRFVMISMTVIFFCLAMAAVNTVDDNYFSEKNQSIFGFQSEPFIKDSDLLNVKDEGAFKDTVNKTTTPPEQPTGLFDAFWGTIIMGSQALTFIVNTLIYTTLDLGSFIQTLGHGEGTIRIIDDYTADIITYGYCICCLMGIGQIIWKFGLKGGA